MLRRKVCAGSLTRIFSAAEGIIGVHPNDNTATIFLATADLVDLLRSEGYSVEVTTL